MLLSMSSGVINHDVAALQPWQNRALAAGRLLLQPVQQVLVGPHALPRAQLAGAIVNHRAVLVNLGCAQGCTPPRTVCPRRDEHQQVHCLFGLDSISGRFYTQNLAGYGVVL
eukprot:COSAG01_NODE_869_length_13031_cov_28.329467_11_plen_112_part_00